MAEARDPPIERRDFVTPQVIDFGDVRVARGLSRRPFNNCPHTNLVYDRTERRVWCETCETTLESFDAFMVFVEYFQRMHNDAERKLKDAAEARAAVIHRIAARTLEATWRAKLAWPCVHCHSGILPEDINGNAVSRDIEVARRARRTKGSGE